MLKQPDPAVGCLHIRPAAFRRLCVETFTALFLTVIPHNQPPSGGCVLKPRMATGNFGICASRLQAAVC